MDYTFENFEVADANRTACEACREVADLRFAGNLPVVLLGPPRSGKSHLLWSIVQRVRARGGHTDLALVLAREFPNSVRALLHDPRPIQRGRPAIFLVDELERFGPLAGELEQVVRLFLENGHAVVVASNVHPSRLGALSSGFRALLQRGDIVEVGLRGPAPEREDARPEEAREALDAEMAHNRRDLDQAREEIEVLQRENGELRRERAALQRRIAETGDLEDDLQTLQRALEAARAEAEAAQSEQARLSLELRALRETALEPAAMADLREELARAREEMEAAFAEQAHLQGALSAYRLGFAGGAEEPDIQPRLDALCERIEHQRAAFEREEQVCRDALGEFAAVLARYEAALTGSAGDAGLPPPDALDQGRLPEVETLTAGQADADSGVEGTLQWARDHLQGMARDLEVLSGARARQAAEALALRQDTAGGPGAVPAEELEVHLGGLESALARARQAGAAEAPAEASDSLRALAARIEALRAAVHPPHQDPAQVPMFGGPEPETRQPAGESPPWQEEVPDDTAP
jgi:hypothetical protein